MSVRPDGDHGRQPPLFGPCLFWPNGWVDQDATWYEGEEKKKEEEERNHGAKI